MICTFKALVSSKDIWKLSKQIFRNKQTWPSSLSSSSRIGVAGMSKKGKAELELLTKIDMLQMLEKGMRGGICYAT